MMNDSLCRIIAGELQARAEQVEAAVRLLDEGNTVPFIARYRKEVTGGLDDTQLRNAVNSPPPDSGLSPALRPRLFSAILCNIFRFSAAVNRSIKLVNDRIASK